MENARKIVELKYNKMNNAMVSDADNYVGICARVSDPAVQHVCFELAKSIYCKYNMTQHTVILMRMQRAIYQRNQIAVQEAARALL